jgi:hypothetical protein
MKTVIPHVLAFALAIVLAVPLAISSTAPANAAVVNVNCGTSGAFTVTDSVVTSSTLCIGLIEIPEGVTAVAANVFKDSGVTSVRFPVSFTTLGDNAFANSANLAVITFRGNAPTVGATPFASIAAGTRLNFYSPATGFGAAGSTWNGMLVNDLTPLPAFAVSADVTRNIWRAGNTALVTAGVNRKDATLSYSWYRCTDAVTATSGGVARTSAPVGCLEIPAVIGTSYVLPETDIGWYVTTLVRTTFNNVTLSYVAPSTKPVLVPATTAKKISAIGGYAAKAVSPTSVMKLRIKGLLVSNPGFTRLHCVGDTKGFAKSATELRLATSRGKAACDYAKSLYPYMTVTYAGKQSKTTGTKSRQVGYTLVP